MRTALAFLVLSFACSKAPARLDPPRSAADEESGDAVFAQARATLEEGRRAFRFDTFGDEDFWGGTLRLHEAIEGAALGGVGPGVSPLTALAVGLKVDVDALPEDVKEGIVAATSTTRLPQWRCST